MLWLPLINEFAWRLSSQSGVRPAVNYGDTITPGQNTKGSWVQIFAGTDLIFDTWGIHVNINSNFVSTAARDLIVDIGIDPAGGSTYTVLIPDLLGSDAHTLLGSGYNYYFPIHIPAGASVAARSSVNNATVGTHQVWLTVFGKPSRPELCRKGSKVIAYGITAASSAGTTVTPGTTSDGSWVSLGTASGRNWWWQFGVGNNDSSMTQTIYFFDLAYGDTTNKHLIFEDFLVFGTSTSEQWNHGIPQEGFPMAEVANGVEIFGRGQCSGTPDSNISMAAYGVVD